MHRLGQGYRVDMSESPKVVPVLQSFDRVGDIGGEEDCTEQELMDRAGIHNREDYLLGLQVQSVART